MISKVISEKKLKEAIRISLEDDLDIVELYDPNVEVNSIDDVVENIYEKIFDIKDFCVCKGVYTSQTLVGYYVYSNMLLISFSISKKHRTQKELLDLFSLIKKDLGSIFDCRLWSKNKRAIKWLEKNEMNIINEFNDITELIYIEK